MICEFRWVPHVSLCFVTLALGDGNALKRTMAACFKKMAGIDGLAEELAKALKAVSVDTKMDSKAKKTVDVLDVCWCAELGGIRVSVFGFWAVGVGRDVNMPVQ
eukprot:1390079-Amorphochlora_amoeboformis.AAC.1